MKFFDDSPFYLNKRRWFFFLSFLHHPNHFPRHSHFKCVYACEITHVYFYLAVCCDIYDYFNFSHFHHLLLTHLSPRHPQIPGYIIQWYFFESHQSIRLCWVAFYYYCLPLLQGRKDFLFEIESNQLYRCSEMNLVNYSFIELLIQSINLTVCSH